MSKYDKLQLLQDYIAEHGFKTHIYIYVKHNTRYKKLKLYITNPDFGEQEYIVKNNAPAYRKGSIYWRFKTLTDLYEKYEVRTEGEQYMTPLSER
ncbi:hypothetical protein GLW08_12620 [Pontibacillus yanchengensis]|uniref:Uncharacterized protein n=1 Tax=Pontibacillus yanchengensis TaxID=462910 RepID=A0ACC7VJ24_9BACI|nr:hypothetical protein [Pontibacillus yanchengensis]MYL54181.1 hypothetical protein [Pontibacillus yanchengensis]